MRNYDEAAIVARLSALDRRSKTAFAASCAERLVPFFERYARSMERPDLSIQLSGIVDSAWKAASGSIPERSLESLQVSAESMVPDDDDGWTAEMGYGQNAAAAAAYAIRTWLTDDPQEAGWAARQVYEAADYVVLQRSPLMDLSRPAAERTVLTSTLVQDALAAVEYSLAAAETKGSDWSALRASAEEDGRRWVEALP